MVWYGKLPVFLSGGSDSSSSQSPGGTSEEATLEWFIEEVAKSEPADSKAKGESHQVQVQVFKCPTCTPCRELEGLIGNDDAAWRRLEIFFFVLRNERNADFCFVGRQQSSQTIYLDRIILCPPPRFPQGGKRLGKRHVRTLLRAVGRDCLEGKGSNDQKVR